MQEVGNRVYEDLASLMELGSSYGYEWGKIWELRDGFSEYASQFDVLQQVLCGEGLSEYGTFLALGTALCDRLNTGVIRLAVTGVLEGRSHTYLLLYIDAVLKISKKQYFIINEGE